MTPAALVALMVVEAGCPPDHPPGVCARVERQATLMAPTLLAAWEEEGSPPIAPILHRVWRESSYRVRPGAGAHGEVGPAQILPATGRLLCSPLRWRTLLVDNLRCGIRVLAWYGARCPNVQRAYTGRCKVEPAQRVKPRARLARKETR